MLGVPLTKYPYLLRDKGVEYVDEVWCADTTYIRMSKGFAYLVAVTDWRTRAVVSWKSSVERASSYLWEVNKPREKVRWGDWDCESLRLPRSLNVTDRMPEASQKAAGADARSRDGGRVQFGMFMFTAYESVVEGTQESAGDPNH